MKVTLEKSFAMPASADVAWVLLQNIEEVAGCMPGAKITERLDATHYKGTVAVKFGPANMSFKGDIEVPLMDGDAKTMRLIGKGTDSTGSSGASMELTARVEAVDAANCNVVGVSEVSVSGKAAAFGNRLMGSVADQVLKQFAAKFAEKVAAMQAAIEVAVPAPVVALAVAPRPAADLPLAASTVPAASAEPLAPAPAPDAQQAPVPMPKPMLPMPAASEPTQLNALALVWAIVRDWFASLFGAKKK